MVKAVFAGSFDPPTNGHLDIITRASKLYDKVIVAVSNNIKKKSFLDKDTRINLLTDCVKNMPNVEAHNYLYNTILKPANPAYIEEDYDWNNIVVTE